MQYRTTARPELSVNLAETDLTYGALYRRMRAAKQERDAILSREKQIDPILFRESRDLENIMQLHKAAFVKSVSQFTNG